MSFLRNGRSRVVAVAAAILLASGLGVAYAASNNAPPSNSVKAGRGIDQYGLTHGYFKGKKVNFEYTHGFYCDKKVKSTATSKCEAGAKWKKAPSKQHDPLYITVPLGFTVPMNKMQCPDGLACVDHPGTMDLRRLEPALKPLYPQLTDAQLTAALANFAVPGHQHFITTKAGHANEWWDVYIIGVTSKAEYNKLNKHASASFALKEAKKGNAVGPIPTNLFLKFAVK